MSQEAKLKAMIGNTYVRNGRYHSIISYKIEEDKIIIVTKDHEFIVLKDVSELKEFLPAPNDAAVTVFTPNVFSKLANKVMDNIDKIEKDPNYIEQATAINKSVDTLIKMASLQISLKKNKDD